MVCANGENSLTFFFSFGQKCSLLTLEVGSITQPKAPRFVKWMKKLSNSNSGYSTSVQCREILEDSVYVNKEEPPLLVPSKEDFGF